MTDADVDLTEREKRVKRLLTWASLLLLVAIAVAGLDVMIKNQILSQAKESQGWIDQLRKTGRDANAGFPEGTTVRRAYADEGGDAGAGGGEPGHADHNGLANVGDVRTGAPADPGPDEGV